MIETMIEKLVISIEKLTTAIEATNQKVDKNEELNVNIMNKSDNTVESITEKPNKKETKKENRISDVIDNAVKEKLKTNKEEIIGERVNPSIPPIIETEIETKKEKAQAHEMEVVEDIPTIENLREIGTSILMSVPPLLEGVIPPTEQRNYFITKILVPLIGTSKISDVPEEKRIDAKNKLNKLKEFFNTPNPKQLDKLLEVVGGIADGTF